MLFEMADDDRQRLEEPRALIPDVVNEGRHCGSSNINLAMENSKRVILIQKIEERERDTHTHTQ